MAALLAAAVAAGAGSSSSRGRISDAPEPEWREGPVRYIITKSEDDEYRQLDSEEARRLFIEAFWRRRDPTPETPGNEYRSQFWKRVRDANGLYSRDTPRPGWLTDMGKVHILFGPPDEIQRDEMAGRRRGIIVWVYRNTPSVDGQRSVLAGPNQVISFAQDGTGEYRLTAEPSKVADVWEGLPDPQPPFGPFKQQEARRRAFLKAYEKYVGLSDPVIRQAGGPAYQSSLEGTMLLARLQQPPREWSLNAEVSTREFFGTLPFKARADFFKTDREPTLVVLTVGIPSRSVTYRRSGAVEEPAVNVYARILDSTATVLVQALDRDFDFQPSPSNREAGLDEDLVFEARPLLRPASYVARLTVTDAVSGRTGTSDTPFTVPDFAAPGLTLSSVLLARRIQPLEGGSADRAAPFVVGSLGVLPHLGSTFRQAEELAFYYQVYGARRDAASGAPTLDVTYTFLAVEGDAIEEVGRVGFQGQSVEAHGYAVPLRDWPAGDYLVRIEVTDTLAAQSVRRDVAFRVAGG
jgi:GWxTD domain-containing protein